MEQRFDIGGVIGLVLQGQADGIDYVPAAIDPHQTEQSADMSARLDWLA
jgi:hypothetical protein